MQSKHLWYIIDISWQELDKKLQVLASTELTCEQLWQHLFLTKHRPFVEGRYKGVDYKEVEKKWEATKKYFQDCKRFTRLFSVNLFFFLLYAAWVRSRAERPSVSYTKVVSNVAWTGHNLQFTKTN